LLLLSALDVNYLPDCLKFVCSSSEASCNGSELKTPKTGVRELAMAMLQIQQMVESRYLNPPLGTQNLAKRKLSSISVYTATEMN